MIVVAEGPSAAGKTTWCRTHTNEFVAEYTPTGAEPGVHDPAAAEFWLSVNCHRWAQAVELEGAVGAAVCDGDPLKLHYSWCLQRVGLASMTRFQQEVAGVRRAFAEERLGLADLILVSIPPPPQLRDRRNGDSTRRRRSFEVNVRLGPALQEWYQAVDDLEPGRVRWDLPPSGVPGPLLRVRGNRCDPRLIDALVEALPDGHPAGDDQGLH